MPILLDRRAFLGGVVAAAAAPLWGADESVARWALLSDTHCAESPDDVYRGFRPQENLKRAVAQVLALKPGACLINGDLARQKGLAGDYRSFAGLISPLVDAFPVAMSLGNHDDRANAIAGLKGPAGERQPVDQKLVSVIEAGPVRMIVLDSLFETNIAAGLLGWAQRRWLETYLGGHADKPTIVFVHHTLDDSDSSMLDADKFLRIVTARKQVKAVFYGHSHAWKREVVEGLHLVNLPAVGYNFADSEPVGWVEAEFDGKGVGLRLRAFAGNRTRDGESFRLAWR